MLCYSVALHCIVALCYPKPTVSGEPGCELKSNATCSPMAQPCCTELCAYPESHQVCSASQECMQEAVCHSETAAGSCPVPNKKDDGELCSSRTKVCLY